LRTSAVVPIRYNVVDIISVFDGKTYKTPTYEMREGTVSPGEITLYRDATIAFDDFIKVSPGQRFKARMRFKIEYDVSKPFRYTIEHEISIDVIAALENPANFSTPWVYMSRGN